MSSPRLPRRTSKVLARPVRKAGVAWPLGSPTTRRNSQMGNRDRNQRYPGMPGRGVYGSQATEGVTGVTEGRGGGSRKIPGGSIREPGCWNTGREAAGPWSIRSAAAGHPALRGRSDPRGALAVPHSLDPGLGSSCRHLRAAAPLSHQGNGGSTR